MHIGGFEILEKVGEGGMATVWKARQISLDRIVAIKVLSARLASDPADVERFLSEARVAAKLKHPGIVQVYDANIERGTYFFVMEYVSGYTVGDWLRRKGVLKESDALLVADCVADALCYAWNSAKMIHCDVKPENILVDSDGTVKVADLGLARTLQALAAEKISDEVMGTPAYMAPEQALGKLDLDFRTDVYSLGAMLYHLVTGKILFEGRPDDQIMELQVTDSAPDPLDLNGNISKGTAWLLEKMLAKDPPSRHESWESVREDFGRVMAGDMPRRPMPERGYSSIQRCVLRTEKDFASARWKDFRRSRTAKALLVAASAAAVLAVGLLAGRSPTAEEDNVGAPEKESIVGKEARGGQAVSMKDESRNDRERDAREMFDVAAKWLAENPTKYAEAIDRFRAVADQTKGSKYSLLADEQIAELSRALKDVRSQVMHSLSEKARHDINDQEFEDAAKLYESYVGLMADETREERLALAARLRERGNEKDRRLAQERHDAEERLRKRLDLLAQTIIEGDLDRAVRLVDEAVRSDDFAFSASSLRDLERALRRDASGQERIAAWFEGKKGQEVKVNTTKGEVLFVPESVSRGTVYGTHGMKRGQGYVRMAVSVNLDDLTAEQKVECMSWSGQEGAIAKGLVFLSAGSPGQARTWFRQAHPLLAERLVNALPEEKKEEGPETVEKGVGKKSSPVEEGAALERPAVEKSKEEPSQSLENVAEHPVVNALLQTNPQLLRDEINVKMDKEGKIRRIQIISPGVINLSALRMCPDVREICVGAVGPENFWQNEPVARLSDISPLKGLSLESLYLGLTSVDSLKALEGMQLRELNMRNTLVEDLSPLAGMPLEAVTMQDTKIRDLQALEGAPLKRLNVAGTRIFDFTPISGAELEVLDVRKTQLKDLRAFARMPLRILKVANTKVYEFGTLRQMPLEELDVSGTQFRDVRILGDLPLKRLFLSRTNVRDIGGLRAMKLTDLSLAGTAVREFDPLRGLRLLHLNVSGCHIEDLSCLKDMPLIDLNISESDVKRLDPLRGMKIRNLSLHGTRVSDLGPLRNLPLFALDCRSIATDDYSPLRGAPIEILFIDNPEMPNVKSVLRSMPNLRQVNTQPWSRW